MKHFLCINIAVLTLLTASVGASAQTKSFFVPKEERTYAQKLGGYAEPDYDFVPLRNCPISLIRRMLTPGRR